MSVSVGFSVSVVFRSLSDVLSGFSAVSGVGCCFRGVLAAGAD